MLRSKQLLVTAIAAVFVSSCASVAGVSDEGVAAGRSSLPEAALTWDNVQESVGDVRVGWVSAFNDSVLEALVLEAQENNKNLQASAAGVDEARALARQAGAAVTPSVNLNAGGQRGGAVEGSAATGVSVGLEASWEADVWGRVRSGSQAAIESLEAAKADYRYAQHSIASAVAKSYLVAIEAKLQVEITNKVFEALTELNRIVKLQADNGLASGQDVALAKADLASAKDSQISAEAGQRDALRALELLLGRYPGADLEVRESLPEIPSPPPAGVPSEILERRPDLVASERRIAAAFNSTSAAKAARLPRFGLSATLGGSSTQLSEVLNPANLAWSAATSLLAPLIDGGLGKARVEQANAQQKQAIAAYADAAQTAFGEVEAALDQGVVLSQRRAALEEAYDEAKEALRIADLRFKEGESDLLSVLQIQQRVFGSESNLLSVQRGQLTQYVDVNLALGGDWRGAQP